MKLLLDQTNILITGASSGIGEALAQQLASRAKTLILVARREERLVALKRKLETRYTRLRVETFSCDVTDQNAVDQMLEKIQKDIGDVDILINNAGMGDLAVFNQADWKKLQQMISLNILALTYLSKRLVGPMIQRRRGGILMVSSTAGFQALPGFGTYGATKYFVRGFSEALRAEVASHHVVISQLCPGPVATEFGAVALEGGADFVPGIFEISAEKCARIAIQGFERGKAVIIPGAVFQLMMFFHKLVPEPVMRWTLLFLAKRIERSGIFAKNKG